MSPASLATLARIPGVNTFDEACRGEWAPFERNPGHLVFLLGCQRSGTTWLHLLLARSGAFRFVSAYDVHAGDRLVHNARERLEDEARRAFAARIAAGPRDRGIDSIPAGADTPEEYGLLLAEGTFRYDRPDTTDATLPRLRALVAKKALLEGTGRPLLLKSPPDYPVAMGLLAGAWPDAQFLVIHRHPLRTLHSQVRAWRSMLVRENSYLAEIDPGYRALFADSGARMKLGLHLHSRAGVDWLLDSILRAHLGFLENLNAWPESSLLSIRYEDLCGDQDATIATVSGFLGMSLPRPPEAPAPREGAIPPDVRSAYAARADAFAPYLARFGYEADVR